MSDTPSLLALLTASGLAERAQALDNQMYRLQWGSAFVIVGVSGTALVAIAPIVRRIPEGREAEFFKRLLEYNAYMGGMASFALQPDGWVVLHAGRAIRGLDAEEFAVLVTAVGRFADQFDDKLVADFFGSRHAAGAPAAADGSD